MELITPEEYEQSVDKSPVPEPYRNFRDREDVPVHEGLMIHDVTEVETDYWERTGQSGAIVNLYGMEGVNDIQIHDLKPGQETKTQRHMYDEIVYVLQGRGVTVLGEGSDKTTFEWSEGGLFAIPRNARYKHLNSSNETTTRLMCQTSLPSWFNVANEDLIFNCEYDPWESTSQQREFYSGEGEEGTLYDGKYEDTDGVTAWFSNFIPDINKFDKLREWNKKMGGMKLAVIPFQRISMHAHLSELPVGIYKKAHRHRPGANVFLRDGQEGYTLLWKSGWDSKKIKLDWKTNSLFTPPAYWYHHHFNLGSEPAGQLAGHFPQLGALSELGLFDPHNADNIIEYIDEDPEIRQLYKQELSERGLESKMPSESYTNKDYEFVF